MLNVDFMHFITPNEKNCTQWKWKWTRFQSSFNHSCNFILSVSFSEETPSNCNSYLKTMHIIRGLSNIHLTMIYRGKTATVKFRRCLDRGADTLIHTDSHLLQTEFSFTHSISTTRNKIYTHKKTACITQEYHIKIHERCNKYINTIWNARLPVSHRILE